MTSPAPSIPTYRAQRMSNLQVTLVALLAASALINYVDRQSVAVVSPLLVKEFHLSQEQWGWVNAVFAGFYVLTSFLGGMWVDRVGVRKGLLISTLIWTAAAAGHALAHDLVSLCFWRVMLAVGEGPGGASLLKGVRRVTPPRLRDLGTGLIGAGTLAGALLAPLLVAPLATQFGWRIAFIVTASLAGLWLPFWIAATSGSKANLEAAGAEDQPPPAGGHTRTLTPQSLGVWATAVCIFFTIPPTVFTLTFFPLYLQATFGLDVKHSAGFQWQPFLAMDLGQIAAGTLLTLLLRRHWSFLAARRVIMTSGFIAATTMTLMTQTHSLAWTMVWLNLSRFSFQFAYVGLLAYGISVVAEREAAHMNGFMNAVFGACNFVFGPLIGRIADVFHKDYRPVIWMVGLIPLVGLAGWTVLSTLHARRTGVDE